MVEGLKVGLQILEVTQNLFGGGQQVEVMNNSADSADWLTAMSGGRDYSGVFGTDWSSGLSR